MLLVWIQLDADVVVTEVYLHLGRFLFRDGDLFDRLWQFLKVSPYLLHNFFGVLLDFHLFVLIVEAVELFDSSGTPKSQFLHQQLTIARSFRHKMQLLFLLGQILELNSI